MLVPLGSDRDAGSADLFLSVTRESPIIKRENGKRSPAGHGKLHVLLWQREAGYGIFTQQNVASGIRSDHPK